MHVINQLLEPVITLLHFSGPSPAGFRDSISCSLVTGEMSVRSSSMRR